MFNLILRLTGWLCENISRGCARHVTDVELDSFCAFSARLLPTLDAGFGSAYGTAKSGVGIATMGVMRPDMVIKSIVPVVMAGILGIYGLIIAVIISTGSKSWVPRGTHLSSPYPVGLYSWRIAWSCAWFTLGACAPLSCVGTLFVELHCCRVEWPALLAFSIVHSALRNGAMGILMLS